MDREGFRNRLKQYKEAKGFDPLLKYWEWKQKYDSAPQPDEMPSAPQPDSQSAGSEQLENRAHRWDSLHTEMNRQPFDSPYDDSRYHDYRKPRFELRKGNVHYSNPDLLKWMGRFGKVLRGGSLLGETVQNLFPSEEAELIEDLRVKMDKQNKWLTGQEDIPKYAGGGEVGEPGLWDKFTNTVSVLYNNAARKVKNFFEEEEAAGEVIDLSNQQLTRVTPDTENLTAIYGNEFVENNANNIRTRKQFEETTDTLIGDKRIPLSKISNFYGVEDGKLKSGDLSIFDENTVVIPNRAKKTGKIKEIIFPDPLSKHKIDSLRRVNRLEQSAFHARLKEFADSLGMDYGSNKFTQIFYGSPYTNLLDRYRKAIRNDSDQEFVKKYNELKKISPRLIEALNQLRHGNISYVTESNDTIRMANTSMPARNKAMYADELGNSLFINNTKNLSKEQQDYVNEKLKVTPMYPILIDNGRYQHYQTEFPNYHTYTSFDFARDPKNMYVIGTTK